MGKKAVRSSKRSKSSRKPKEPAGLAHVYPSFWRSIQPMVSTLTEPVPDTEFLGFTIVIRSQKWYLLVNGDWYDWVNEEVISCHNLLQCTGVADGNHLKRIILEAISNKAEVRYVSLTEEIKDKSQKADKYKQTIEVAKTLLSKNR